MADAKQLAARAFKAAEYDFSRLMDVPQALMHREDRHGVRLLIAPTFALPDAALDAILSWRLGQYLLTRFYDADVVADQGLVREDAATVHAADVHGLAIDPDGGLLTYLTLKQPEELEGFRYGSADRPAFPCEEVHGRGWQQSITDAGDVPAEHPTSPFIANAGDLDWATFVRWADIDLALNSGEEETYLRFLLLRQFVSVKESSLKRPNEPRDESRYPVEALTSSSSLGASNALWRSATAGAIPWQALTLGPGEPLPRDRVSWIVEGFAQGLTYRPEGLAHLAGIGPEVCFVPHESIAGSIASLDAATPLRALTTTREDFESFWRQRQALFETSSEKLYGMTEIVRAAEA